MTTLNPTEVSSSVVHVVFARLDPPLESVAKYRALLSPEELKRADRYVTGRLTRSFSVCRGVLRILLGEILGCAPVTIDFETGPHGKPRLPTGSSDVEFNVSHSDDLACLVFTRNRALGVDLEAMDPRHRCDDLVTRFFSEPEQREYFSLPEELRLSAFYRLWTCKEAFLKVTGHGLSFPLADFTVRAHPQHPPGLLHVEHDSQAAERYTFVIPEVPAGFAAAIAVDGHDWTLKYHHWQHVGIAHL